MFSCFDSQEPQYKKNYEEEKEEYIGQLEQALINSYRRYRTIYHYNELSDEDLLKGALEKFGGKK